MKRSIAEQTCYLDILICDISNYGSVCEIGPIVPNPDYTNLGNQDSAWFHVETGQLILSYHDPANTRQDMFLSKLIQILTTF
ncbi:hypothetical protein CHS0354_014128 [Potamilus streckersoni]|uniref:Uncharacterized protein n=1 Tax=Potamilus streckersoni TaxID=2493646 RepID=A0AAE0WG88_9BIVA|nr:hypothetical protein CHS0354_014128 [Potamilus streckersoni]